MSSRSPSKLKAFVCVAAFVAAAHAFALPSYSEVRAQYSSSDGELLDRNGQLIQETRRDPKLRRLKWVELEMISPSLRETIVRSEDKRFWSHGGVDWLALGAAAVRATLPGTHARGASTIPMQLVEFLRHDLLPRYVRKGVSAKVRQVREALELDPRAGWTKEHILEAYLNLVSFRGELQGVAAASQALFDRDAHGLGEGEALILAALVRSPGARAEDVERRACALGRDERGPSYDCADVKRWLAHGALEGRAIRPREALAPHVAARLASPGGAKSIRTTLDGDLQRWVGDVLRRQVLTVRAQNVRDAAAVVLDNRTGDVLAYVGGIGSDSSARYVDGVRAPRQAGSTLKPFLYGLAIDRRYLTAASPVEDLPTDIQVGSGLYRPRNYDKEFHGRGIPVRSALSASLNVPAVRALTLVGVDPFVQALENLGFTGLREPEYYGPSLALGSADITLWDLTLAYRALANGGEWSDAHLVQSGAATELARPPRRVYSREAAFVIGDILSDRESRALTFGLENPLSLPFWAAAKTGTSKDMRDNWCVGYSDRYTVGVWVGNFSGAPMWNVTGISGAAPAWAEILKWLHRTGRPSSHSPAPPSGVLRAQAEGRPEWFLRGTEPSGVTLAPSGPSLAHVHITYPVEGMVVALDPDIPADRQRLFFESDVSHAARESLHWIVNGENWSASRVADGFPILAPERAPGRVEVALADARGKVLDRVTFQIRGAMSDPSDL